MRPLSTYHCLLGIDPGVETGLSAWLRKPEPHLAQVGTFPVHKAMDQVKRFHDMYGLMLLVRFEDARLRKWFGRTGPEVWKGAGSICRDCKIWEDFLEDFGIWFQSVAPMNNKTKVTHEYFTQLTGWSGSTNEHSRDSAMLVYGY